MSSPSPANARDYLADDLDAETEDHDEPDSSRYGEAAELLRSIDATDPLCTRLAYAIEPYLSDDARVDGTLYPGGRGMRFLIDVTPPLTEQRQRLWLHDLVLGLEADRRHWSAIAAEAGDAARWLDWNGPTIEV